MEQQKKSTKIGLIFVILLLGLLIAFVVKLYTDYLGVQEKIQQLTTEEAPVDIPVRSQIVERLVSKTDVWRPIQDGVKDTVVQVFAQVVEFDFMQPYRTSSPYPVSGSAFFINDQGDLITNAHVISQAREIWIQIPSLGKRIIDVEVIGVSPERDIALLRVKPHSLEMIRNELGSVSYLPLGDSDLVHRADEVLALGYPLGMQSLKSTTGVISGREQQFIQMSAPINPGNSGGPLLNVNGEVIGINAAGVMEAQNVGYIIPINDLKIVLPDLYRVPLLRKPFLGVLFNNATDSLTTYLKNPQPGGCYVVEVVPGSTLHQAGVERGDMIYEINGNRLDLYGEMSVPWSEDRISIVDYVSRLSLGQDVHLVVYRHGERKQMTVKFSEASLPSIRKVYPGFEDVDYEIFGGMVVMPLTINHINGMSKMVPGLSRYTEMKYQKESRLIITHVFPTSQLYRTRTVSVGATINEINGIPIRNLDEFRQVFRNSKDMAYMTMTVSDNYARTSDNIMVALPFNAVIEDEMRLSKSFTYPLSDLAKELLQYNAHIKQQKA